MEVVTETLTDDELVSTVRSTLAEEDNAVARSIAYLIEVENRRLHLKLACSSMNDFCVRKLGMSDGKARRRVTGANIAKCFPTVLDAIADGRVCLTHVSRLRDHFTKENVDTLLTELAACRTRRQVDELLARLSPKPDVEESIEELPHTATSNPPGAGTTEPTHVEVRPLSPGRYQLTLTIGEEDLEALERLRDMRSHQHPDRKIEPIISTAIKKYLAEMEKDRCGSTEPPRDVRPPRDPATITVATRREVHRRDGGRCAFVDTSSGERCPARAFLELDHRLARAHGGTGDADNVRLLCPAHNRFVAELAFGREHIEDAIARSRESAAAQRAQRPPIP